MRLRLNELRRIIRTVILEGEEKRVYDDTVLPGEEADEELLAEPDLTDQDDRDEYIQSKQDMASKKKKARSHSREETGEHTGDEHAMAGHIGPMGASGNGPGNKPYGRPKKLRSRNAMGGKNSKRHLDEYDE